MERPKIEGGVPTVSFIGSGNVATHIAKAFYKAGYPIQQILSREYDHAAILANAVHAEPIDKWELLSPTAAVYILAVSDDALFDLALDLRLRDALVIHTAGSVSLNVLRPISRRHGVLWAPQTFIREVDMDYSSIPFCVEGSTRETVEEIEELIRPISRNIYRVDTEQRKWLHLGAVMVNNFGNCINALAQEMIAEHHLDFEILHPLIDLTATKIKQGDLWQQQTGPARRRDQKTIDNQRRLLANNKELLEIYDMMTEVIERHTCSTKINSTKP